jgi:hypothetical protein
MIPFWQDLFSLWFLLIKINELSFADYNQIAKISKLSKTENNYQKRKICSMERTTNIFNVP